MLHTRTDNSGLVLQIRQFESECSNCIGLKASGLCFGCLHRSHALVVKLAERISAATGQENGQENNRRNVEQF